jgi:Short C-terminal domain
MIMRRRPLLRAAVVGGGAYMAGKRTAQREEEGRQAAASAYQQTSPQVPAQPGTSMLDQLAQLSDMHDKGALTDDEFATAKARLLAG